MFTPGSLPEQESEQLSRKRTWGGVRPVLRRIYDEMLFSGGRILTKSIDPGTAEIPRSFFLLVELTVIKT